MKTNVLQFLLILLSVAFVVPAAYAQQSTGKGISGTENEVRNRMREEVRLPEAGIGTRTEERTRNDIRAKAEDDGFVEVEIETETQSSSNTQSKRGRSEEHQSAVARFIRNLNNLADRDGDIGDEVRAIAHEQASSSDRVVEALQRVENRSRVRTFFFGPDYKNLGELRSEMVQTRNRIEQLNRVLERAASSTDTVALREEIRQMEEERTRIEQYVDDQEGRFSLLGWVVRMFR